MAYYVIFFIYLFIKWQVNRQTSHTKSNQFSDLDTHHSGGGYWARTGPGLGRKISARAGL